MKIGNPLDRDTNHGPQNHEAHLRKLVEWFKDLSARKSVAKCLSCIQRPENQGTKDVTPVQVQRKKGADVSAQTTKRRERREGRETISSTF